MKKQSGSIFSNFVHDHVWGRTGRIQFLADLLSIGVTAIGGFWAVSIIAGLFGDWLLFVLTPFLLIFPLAALVWAGKRCHDLERSAWWTLLLLIPGLNLVCFLEMALRKGAAEDNAYGPVPDNASVEMTTMVIAVFGGLALASIILLAVLMWN